MVKKRYEHDWSIQIQAEVVLISSMRVCATTFLVRIIRYGKKMGGNSFMVIWIKKREEILLWSNNTGVCQECKDY